MNNESFYYFRTTTKLRSDDTAGFMRLSVLHYHLGEAEESLNEVRECLRLDPDHKDCFTLYKKLKKVAKFVVAAREARNSEEWDDCKDAAKKVSYFIIIIFSESSFLVHFILVLVQI